MGIVCGWSGNQPVDSHAVISDMVEGSRGVTVAAKSTCAGHDFGIGTLDAPDCSLYQSSDLCTAIEGTPQWRDQDLEAIGREHGPSHALAEGFRRYGKKVLGKLYGTFSLCILKPDRQYLLLAVDRIGVRPLAYTLSGSTLIFGSQTGCISAHPEASREIDPQGLFNYLYFHMIPSPGSIYKNICKLQPAEAIEFSDGKLNREFYWQLRFSEEKEKESVLAERLRDELKHSVSACLTDTQTGTFLSGGLDSSTVTGVYQSINGSKVDAFAIGFDAEGFDEMDYARASARHFGATLHEYYVTPDDVLKAIPLIASAYDEPFGNASAIPAYYCAKFARENGITTLLAGDGGDEIFAGNSRYAKQLIFDFYRHVPGPVKALVEPIAFNLPPLRKLKSYIEQAKVPMPQRMETYNFLHRTPLEQIFAPEFLDSVDTEMPLSYLQATYDRADSDHLLKKMLFLDHKFTLADNDLRKVNRMCELAGVSVRYPLLQDDMVSFSAGIPADMLLKRLELRSFFRNALKDFLAKETLDKSKHGFGLPFGLWLNEHKELNEFADGKLRSIKARGILQQEYIDKIIDAHHTGHASYYGVMIWILVILEQWLECHQ